VAAYAGEDHDVSRVLRPEERESRLDEVDLREEDCFELVPDEVLRDWRCGEFFYCADNRYVVKSATPLSLQLQATRSVRCRLFLLTFRLAAQKNINPPKHLHRLGHSSTALPHNPSIAPNSAYSILPPLTVFPAALALVDQLPELGAPVVVLDLVRREASHHVVAVPQKQPHQSYDQR
jgi:hypothetical protein